MLHKRGINVPRRIIRGAGPQIISMCLIMRCTPNSALVDRVDFATPLSLSSRSLPASRLLPPRSGLERSDFVPWPEPEEPSRPLSGRYWWVSGRGSSLLGRRAAGRSPTFRGRAGIGCLRNAGRDGVALRGYALQEFEQVTVGGKDERRVFGDHGLVGLHGPRELVECRSLRALVIGLGVDFGGLRVRHAADLLNLTVGFRLDLVEVAYTIAANSGGLAIAFRQEPLRDLPPFTDHAIVNLRAHAFIVVDPLEPDIEQFNAKHANLFGSLGEDLLLDQLASLLDRHQRPDVQRTSRVVREDIAQRHTILGGADDLDQFMLGDGVTGL